MMIIFVKLRLCNEKCSSSTKTPYYSFKPNLVENRSLKKLQQVYLLASTPSFTTISLPLIYAVHDERGHPHQWIFLPKTPLAWGELCSRSTSFFSSASFFSLTPKNPNDHHLHQHSQTPNNLPIVWCLTNNLLTSWSLIPILNLNSSKKITSINVLPHHLNQSAPSKFNFFFLSDQPIWQQNSSPNPSNSHQSSNSNLNSSFPSSTLLLLCILVALLLHGITP